MEEGFKVRRRIFERIMEKEDNKVNWERLCCADKPLVPFMGAGTSAWCYPLWNTLLEQIVEETYSKECVELVKRALECSKKRTTKCKDSDEEFPWMEEIAECIFNDDRRSFKKGRRKFDIGKENEEEQGILRNLRSYVGEEWRGKKLEAEQALYRIFDPALVKESRMRPEYQNYFPILFQDILITTNYDKALEYCYPSILSYSYNDLNLYRDAAKENNVAGDRNTKKGAKETKQKQKESWLFNAVNEKLKRMNDKMKRRESGLPAVTVPDMPMLLKVHGSIERASDIALTRAGYERAYCPELIELLHNIFEKSTLLFIGYSLCKDRITDELKKLKDKQQEEAKEKTKEEVYHFAFLPLERSEEKKALEKFGVYPIYYSEDVLDELIEDKEEREKVFHDYCLGILFENLARRQKGDSKPLELLWEKDRFEEKEGEGQAAVSQSVNDRTDKEIEEQGTALWKRRQREAVREQIMKQRNLQYVRRKEAVQIWKRLNASGECPLIAITGAVGSGRSTLCQSIQEGCGSTMQFFSISLANCKSWDEFCIRLLQGMNIVEIEIPEMQEWRKLARKVADKCCVYWRSVLILDHLDDLEAGDKSGRLWETVRKILNYWKEQKTRVIFVRQGYPDGISCYTWQVRELKKDEAEKVFFDACSYGYSREVTYMEKKVVGELFAKQVFRPSSINLLGRYAKSKNDLTGLLEEWELYYLPGDSGEQTVTRILWQHLLREHKYDKQEEERKKAIKNNILWIWGILGNYPGMFPSCFFKAIFDTVNNKDYKDYKDAELSQKTLIFMKNIGLCMEVENENQINLLENMIDCVERYFIQPLSSIKEGVTPGCEEVLEKFRKVKSEKDDNLGMKKFRGYSMAEWESSLRDYIWEELPEEDRDVKQDSAQDIRDVLNDLGDRVKDNKHRTENRALDLVLHYEIKTVIRFLHTCLLMSKGDEEKEREDAKLGYKFSIYYHYVPNYAETLVSRLLGIMERDIREKGRKGWKLYEAAEMNRVMGDVKRLLGKKEEALEYYKKAEDFCYAQMLEALDGEDSPSYRESRRIQAGVQLIHNYNYDKEIKVDELKKTLDIYEALEDKWGKAYCCQRMGEMLYAGCDSNDGKFNEMKGYYDMSAKFYKKVGDETGLAYIWKCRGDLVEKYKKSWKNNRNWKYDAIECYVNAFLYYCHNINWRGFANVIQAMETFRRESMDGSMKEDDIVAMEKLYGLAEECYRWLGDVRGLADTLDYLGHGYKAAFDSNQDDIYRYKALRCWMESRELWEKQGNRKKCDEVRKEIENIRKM